MVHTPQQHFCFQMCPSALNLSLIFLSMLFINDSSAFTTITLHNTNGAYIWCLSSDTRSNGHLHCFEFAIILLFWMLHSLFRHRVTSSNNPNFAHLPLTQLPKFWCHNAIETKREKYSTVVSNFGLC